VKRGSPTLGRFLYAPGETDQGTASVARCLLCRATQAALTRMVSQAARALVIFYRNFLTGSQEHTAELDANFSSRNLKRGKKKYRPSLMFSAPFKLHRLLGILHSCFIWS